jgi:peptide/nickel transport system permease protein
MPEQSPSSGPGGPPGVPHPTPTDGSGFFGTPYGPGAAVLDFADASVREQDVFGAIDPEDAAVDAPERVERKLGIGFWVAAGWMAVLVILAAIAPFITEDDPSDLVGLLPDPNAGISSDPINNKPDQPPFSTGHPLGTDSLGRDILSRVIWGGRVSIVVGFAAIAFGLTVGGFIGLSAGFFRGKLETVLMAMMDILLAFPALILALAIVTFTNSKTLPVITLAIGIVGIPPLARLVRANTLVYSQREFVLAARTLGAKNYRIMWREIVPNVARAAFSFAIIGIAVAIVAEGGLAFLGISIPPPDPTWGTMINEGRTDLQDAPWISMVPATVLFFTVMALNFAGDRLRGFFDVKEGGL